MTQNSTADKVTHASFTPLLLGLPREFKTNAVKVQGKTWQGTNIEKRPEMVSYDLINWRCVVPLRGIEDITHWQANVSPNLPWADDHFEERVCGKPINPGREWANWPWGKSASGFLDEEGMFDHNYMERYWPKYAGLMPATGAAVEYDLSSDFITPVHQGIRFSYGDLKDLVQQLAFDPTTRQAYLPMFFPEDTGRNGRKPCSLGYQFWAINDGFYVWYPMRSCDAIRHLQDDIYLTIRLMLWVLGECRKLNPQAWENIKPRLFSMHVSRLHIFEHDYRNYCNIK